jgi:hypothetical protein
MPFPPILAKKVQKRLILGYQLDKTRFPPFSPVFSRFFQNKCDFTTWLPKVERFCTFLRIPTLVLTRIDVCIERWIGWAFFDNSWFNTRAVRKSDGQEIRSDPVSLKEEVGVLNEPERSAIFNNYNWLQSALHPQTEKKTKVTWINSCSAKGTIHP